MRRSGILLHITSLPGNGGIGTLGREAYEYVDFLAKAGVKVWQVLPIGPTGYGESPYQSGSTFAGNPLLIDLETLWDQGLMNGKDLFSMENLDHVEFEQLKEKKDKALRACFASSFEKVKIPVKDYLDKTPWLKDYALYAALKTKYDLRSWMTWPEEIRRRDKVAINDCENSLKDEIDYQCFLQYLFDMQWRALKEYANKKGVLIMGDIPIYVAEDSADTWAHPENFQFDKQLHPVRVAGVPPDYFCEDGQLWGNPLYNWKYLKRHKFAWWMDRFRGAAERYDILRIDHFIGFANFWSVPAGAPNARNGEWVKAPGKKLFRRVAKELPELEIVAEDLGEVNDRVRKLLADCGFPGMKVLQFAFGSDDSNMHLPQNLSENTAFYTATHDNDTTVGYWVRIDEKEKANTRRILGDFEDDEACAAYIKAVMESVAKLAVIPMQDLLGLDNHARMNSPGTLGGNWLWRMTKSDFEEMKEKAGLLRELLTKAGRIE